MGIRDIIAGKKDEQVTQPEVISQPEGALPEDEQTQEPEPVVVKMVPKKVVCPRCKGDGIWHSSRTGVRAATSTEPTIDATRKCPQCKGSKKVTIMITKEQAEEEADARVARKKADNAAKQARAAADKAEKVAKNAEAKLS